MTNITHVTRRAALSLAVALGLAAVLPASTPASAAGESRYAAVARDLHDARPAITPADLHQQALADPEYADLWDGVAAELEAVIRAELADR